MPAGAIVGLDCKLYRLTTGTRTSWDGTTDVVVSGAAPSNLDEVTAVRDVTLSLEKGEADASVRGSVFARRVTALIDGTVDFQLVRDSNTAPAADFVAFRDACLNRTTIACAVLDGASDTTGSQGLWADFEVLKCSRAEPLTDVVSYDVSMKPATTSVDPQWVTVST